MSTEIIFHEKQDGRMCAQHCLNSVLQGSYFTPIDLSELAKRLDEDERQYMAENGIDSDTYLDFIRQPSGNMDDTGYFSVQVINKALALWNLELIPLHSKEEVAEKCQKDATVAKAYIFNMENHWFCIRKFVDSWYNLDSLLNGPQPMSSFFVDVYLKQMQQEGYSVFIVNGVLPECLGDKRSSEDYLNKASHSSTISKENSRNDELELAMQLSLVDLQKTQTSSSSNLEQPCNEDYDISELRAKRLSFFRNL